MLLSTCPAPSYCPPCRLNCTCPTGPAAPLHRSRETRRPVATVGREAQDSFVISVTWILPNGSISAI